MTRYRCFLCDRTSAASAGFDVLASGHIRCADCRAHDAPVASKSGCFYCGATDLTPADTYVNLTNGRIYCRACHLYDPKAV